MNTTLWIITSVLAVAYTVGAGSQLLMSKEKYRSLAESQHWVDDFSAGQIKAIGTIKLIGAIGLVLPTVGNVAPVLVPLAACGLMLFMAGAATTRFRRSEWALMAGDVVFLALFGFVAWGRFDLAPFV
ncbi:DoxX family protein [Gordonia sp. HY002]|uniref:DoxX family protein n=1 Tax=Gordonia zhenghanii TaxID=2911516 RepID=UPI001EF1253E|nr:DoxX family protein [Gordonia zhenghanii]MCF8569916.1 DoxX family protein [Gordonia zhenghanii]MCF8605513.1 DoxX family protein [Gordonia zhenghanii]